MKDFPVPQEVVKLIENENRKNENRKDMNMNMLELAQNNLDTAKSNLVYRLKNPINLPDDWFYIMEGEEDISKWRNIVRRIREGEEEEEMVVLASGEVTTCCVDLNGKKGEE